MKSERESSCARLSVQSDSIRPSMVKKSPLQFEIQGHLAKNLNRQLEQIKSGNHSTVLYEVASNKDEKATSSE